MCVSNGEFMSGNTWHMEQEQETGNNDSITISIIKVITCQTMEIVRISLHRVELFSRDLPNFS